MTKIRRSSRWLALLLVLTVLLTVQASAAESGSLWANATVSEDTVTVYVVADTAVSSGVITLSYDRKELKFQEVTVEESAVAAHAVNGKVGGKVQISWVAPAEQAQQDSHVLLQVRFTGTSAESIDLSGTVYDLTGGNVAVVMPDLAALNSVLAEADALQADTYTADSLAAVQSAAAEAKALLQETIVSPAQVDAAVAKLTEAISRLVKPTPSTQPVTKPATQPTTSQGGEAGGWIGVAVAIGAVCVAAAVVVVVIVKKRGKKECV